MCVCVPNQQRWYAKWRLGRNMCTLRTRFFATFGRRFACSAGDCRQSFCIGAQEEVLLRGRCWSGEHCGTVKLDSFSAEKISLLHKWRFSTKKKRNPSPAAALGESSMTPRITQIKRRKKNQENLQKIKMATAKKKETKKKNLLPFPQVMWRKIY